VSIGFVTGLDYADATLSVHDCLQQFKSHKLVRGILEGGRRIHGARRRSRRGLPLLPKRMHVPGAVLCGDSAGFVNMSALKGVHYAIQSGILAAEAIYESLKAGTATATTGLWGTTRRSATASSGRPVARAQRPAGVQQGFLYARSSAAWHRTAASCRST